MHQIIFFGNGPLADTTKNILESQKTVKIIFHAREKSDLETVKNLKQKNPAAFGILASFGVLIKSDVLDLFEPEGILNLHPSLLPLYRGPSPIETAILRGDTTFSVSIMKLVKQMDAGPVYYQKTLKNLPLDKTEIYTALATAGATWLSANLDNFAKLRTLASPSPTPLTNLFPLYHLQDDKKATFTKKLDKSMALLAPDLDSAATTLQKIVALQTFPKPRIDLFGQTCIILSAHLATKEEIIQLSAHPTAEKEATKPLTPSPSTNDTVVHTKNLLALRCADNRFILIDRLQPLSRKPMDPRSFLNGLR